jgi:hypothetical protein
MPSHKRYTRIKRPVIRESDLSMPETGRPLMIRLDPAGLVLWEKQTQKRFRIRLPKLLQIVQDQARKARLLQAKRQRLNNRRAWARYFLSILNDGYDYREIARFLLVNGITNAKGQPWTFAAINFCVLQELKRVGKALERKEAMAVQAAKPQEGSSKRRCPSLGDPLLPGR